MTSPVSKLSPAKRRHLIGHLILSALYGALGVVAVFLSGTVIGSSQSDTPIGITAGFVAGVLTAYAFIKCGQELQTFKIELAIAVTEEP